MNEIKVQTYGKKNVLQTAGHLPFNAVLNVPARNLLVLLKHCNKKKRINKFTGSCMNKKKKEKKKKTRPSRYV